MARGAAATAASRSARPASSNNQNSHYIPQSESGESSDPDEGNAFLKFAAANQETSNSHFSIATYMENEPDVEVSPLFHNHCELSKTKAEQDAEQRCLPCVPKCYDSSVHNQGKDDKKRFFKGSMCRSLFKI